MLYARLVSVQDASLVSPGSIEKNTLKPTVTTTWASHAPRKFVQVVLGFSMGISIGKLPEEREVETRENGVGRKNREMSYKRDKLEKNEKREYIIHTGWFNKIFVILKNYGLLLFFFRRLLAPSSLISPFIYATYRIRSV